MRKLVHVSVRGRNDTMLRMTCNATLLPFVYFVFFVVQILDQSG